MNLVEVACKELNNSVLQLKIKLTIIALRSGLYCTIEHSFFVPSNSNYHNKQLKSFFTITR
jgi:hypothetical protein